MKFSFLWLLSQNGCKGSAVFSAYMNISFQVGNRMLSELGEAGVFGRSSALKRVVGVIVPPEGKLQSACNPYAKFKKPNSTVTWFALIERGGCTFSQKIKVAVENGASGVIIYNFPGTGNQVFPMSHQTYEGIVVVMIGNLKGLEILHLIKKGVFVTVMIDVGRKHIIWINYYVILFVIVTTATIAYFIFYHIRRLLISRIQNRRWRRITIDLKKALGQLQVRVLKEGDEEISSNGDSCVVCFELYKPNDTIRILTCKHFFHKDCIDPWILSHGTCPMCKCDILKALGIQVDIESGTEPLQMLMSNELSCNLSPNEEGINNELPPPRRSEKATQVEKEEHPTSQNDNEPNSVAEIVQHSL